MEYLIIVHVLKYQALKYLWVNMKTHISDVVFLFKVNYFGLLKIHGDSKQHIS